MPNVANLMESSLPGPVLDVLRSAAVVASREAVKVQELYLVGGMVRDLLRGESSIDIDLSVQDGFPITNVGNDDYRWMSDEGCRA